MALPEDACRPSNPEMGSPLQGEEILYRIFEFAPDAMLLVNRDGIITKVNMQTEKMFGYDRRELYGQPVEILIPSRFTARHVGHRSSYMSSPRTRPMGAGLDLFGRRKDNSEFPVDIMLSPLNTEEGAWMLGVVRDVTERKAIEEQARRAQEMLFSEIHHRVKNNLQVISSLLFLQSTYITDPATLAILTESQARVKSIALIHEKLYRSPNSSRVDFSQYVHDLVSDLFRTYGVNQEGIDVRTTVGDVFMEIDTAVPCGLIINELVSNVLKHAFPDRRSGAVTINLEPLIPQTEPKTYVLTVEDDGVGLPQTFELSTCNSLGLKLVTDLTRQLNGTARFEGDGGTKFTITFRELHYKDRG